jgi:hypothetical protein
MSIASTTDFMAQDTYIGCVLPLEVTYREITSGSGTKSPGVLNATKLRSRADALTRGRGGWVACTRCTRSVLSVHPHGKALIHASALARGHCGWVLRRV